MDDFWVDYFETKKTIKIYIMKVYMRMLWQFDITQEERFMELEKKFAELESRREDYPKGGKRLQPISGMLPCNTITWEKEFSSLEEAYAMVEFFRGDEEHEKLGELQRPLFKDFRIEFYKVLEF
jgi:hypothetical protein